MKTHPEIPPNCHHFVKLNVNRFKVMAFFVGPNDRSEVAWISPETGSFHCLDHIPSWRPIIASVAAEYWLIEKQRRVSAAECSKYRMDEARGLLDVECDGNADEWRKWGNLIK